MTRLARVHLLVLLCACGPSPADDDGGTAETDGASDGGTNAPTSGEAPTSAAPTSAPPDGSSDTGDTGGASPPGPDGDEDGFPDDVDLCPSVADESNVGDVDRDGIGSGCDLCPRQPQQYNDRAGAAGAPVYMQVRNVPHQADFDRDGVADVCDNCIVRPNCAGFGAGDGLTPAHIGDAIPFDDLASCQVDQDDAPYLGDACVDPVTQLPVALPDAAGPVGFLDDDDFDQDGLKNLDDRCPRIRVEAAGCGGPEQCGGAECTDGRCNHPDGDGDGVGDLCDSCPFAFNAEQVLDGGQQEDDPDADFVGGACESHAGCTDRADPRPVGFFTLSAGGMCCTALFDAAAAPLDPGLAVGEGDACAVVDPALPLTVDCPEGQEDIGCRRLPAAVVERPGVVALPPGCAAAGEPVVLGSPGVATHDDLYRFACRLPARDADFDGVGDVCDLCPNAFDPANSEAFCTGDYSEGHAASCP
ncbi:MAG: thrombospondin type 3 repeat-containing protein [Myxococcales bacterium]|nr:thrombospondin type 3 repeat-containing protein [Myxococcales bacterium]